MEHGLDFLTTSFRDTPTQHRSLRAVVDRSWLLLTPRQQAVLLRCAVFRGGFTGEAARAVAGASLADLAELVDRSLLHRTPPNRYHVHEVVRQYVAELLAEQPTERAAVRQRHSVYCAAFLQERDVGLRGARQADALREIDVDIDNVRAAWDWAVAQGQADVIAQAVRGLARFYELQGWLREGEAAMGRAISVLDDLDAAHAGRHPLLVGQLLGWQGRLAHFLGRYAEANALLERSVTLLRPLDAGRDLAFSLNNLARQVDLRGQYDAARRLNEEAVALFRTTGDRYGLNLALNHLGGIALEVGDFAAARRHWEASLSLSQEISDPITEAYNLSSFAKVALCLGDFAEARRRAEQSWEVLRRNGGGWRIMHPLEILGTVAWAEGSYEDAYRLHDQRLAIAIDIGDRRRIADALLKLAQIALVTDDLATADALGGLGHTAAMLGDLEAARQLRTDALQTLVEIGALPSALRVVVAMAEHLLHDRQEEAVALLSFVQHHPAAWRHTREDARQLLVHLGGTLPTDTLTTARERGQSMSIDDVAALFATTEALGVSHSPLSPVTPTYPDA